jgi:hypothetical protein
VHAIAHNTYMHAQLRAALLLNALRISAELGGPAAHSHESITAVNGVAPRVHTGAQLPTATNSRLHPAPACAEFIHSRWCTHSTCMQLVAPAAGGWADPGIVPAAPAGLAALCAAEAAANGSGYAPAPGTIGADVTPA